MLKFPTFGEVAPTFQNHENAYNSKKRKRPAPTFSFYLHYGYYSYLLYLDLLVSFTKVHELGGSGPSLDALYMHGNDYIEGKGGAIFLTSSHVPHVVPIQESI